LLAKGQLMVRSNPIEAINLAEQVLNSDPNSVSGHRLLAEAALLADFPKTAVLSLEIALRNAPKDREIALELGEALKQTGQTKRAESVYTELQKAYPNDPIIAQAFKNLSAHRTLKEGGYEQLAGGEGSYRDILKDKEEARTLEQEKREVKSEDVAAQLIRDYEQRLAQEPGNLRLMRSVAELYTKRNEFDKALDYYNRMLAMENVSDPSLERAASETRLRKLDHALSKLDPSSPDYAAEAARIQSERQAFELSECRRRVEKYPNDLNLRFELGELYFQNGKITEAIQEFQRAQANPHRRIASLTYLGKCFARRGFNDMAVRSFRTAINEKAVLDDEKKDLIYELGLSLEKLGKADEAIEQFKQIYEADIGYKDVAAKIDAYYASKGG
jgi:tetratricopeptide (TPR) repeat protein